MAKQIAVNSAVRLNSMELWRATTYGHAFVLKTITDAPDNFDFWVLCLGRKFIVRISGELLIEEITIDVFTDESKESLIRGIYILGFGKNISFKLSDLRNIY